VVLYPRLPPSILLDMPAPHPNPTKGNNTFTVTVTRHPEYFFHEADVTFRAEDVVFRVHKRFFLRESAFFRSLFTAPPIPCNDPPGSSETNPIVLKDTSSDAFALLLWVFYNPKYSIYATTVDKWTQILTLAQKWAFREVEQLCIRELENLSIPPVEKIWIYQEFKLDRSLLLSSFAKLVVRPDPLSLEEGQKLGLETTLKIAQARELSRSTSSGRPAVIQLHDSELRSSIRDVFGLDEDAFDFMESTPPQKQQQQQHPTHDNMNGKKNQRK